MSQDKSATSDGAAGGEEPLDHIIRENIPQTLWDRIRDRQRFTTRRVTKSEYEARKPPPPWQVAAYQRLHAILTERLAAHSPEWDGRFGEEPARDFWCAECRRLWPCPDATALMRYSDSDNPVGYKLELTLTMEPTE